MIEAVMIPMVRLRRNPAWWRGAVLGLLILGGCGGGGGGAAPEQPSTGPSPGVVEMPSSREAARRFLTQATFGPSDTDVDRLMAVGYAAWIDEQLARTPASVRTYVEAIAAARRQVDPSATIGQAEVIDGIWKQMLSDPAQLRQRLAYAWSQIFVISLVDGGVHNEPRAAAAYFDMLGSSATINYRQLLESVTLHPMMGKYLSHLGNRKADALSGRVPDENFAREVMQLFSIGLYELNADGSRKLQNGSPLETYVPDDVSGLARVFTGFSWDCPAFPSEGCFRAQSSQNFGDNDAGFKPMKGYAQWHSTELKSFLGSSIAIQGTADPTASLRVALDRLHGHPNVGPFIGRQLIQRLVTSNPSPAYVSAVSAAFADNGSGVRGDLKAVVKAVLMHPEARAASTTGGKVREPVLRMTAFARAFPLSSFSGTFNMGGTDSVVFSLGQTPLRAPSVFNFFRPGFVVPSSQTATAGLVAPEMQLVDETTTASWVNFIRAGIERNAVGQVQTNGLRDIQLDFSAEMALAEQPAALADRIRDRLLYGNMSAGLKTEIVDALQSVAIPAISAGPDAIAAAQRTRVNVALLLALASTEFVIQR